MKTGIVTALFLLLAVGVALGILTVVALPHLRHAQEHRSETDIETRHRSRTGRGES